MNELEKRVLSLLDETEIAKLLQALIRARSDYPPGDTREAAKICADKLKEYGVDVQIICPPPTVVNPKDHNDNLTMPSVIGTIRGAPGPTLLLNAHIDTVTAGDLSEWDFDPYSAVIQDGLVYGRGAGDDKGSVCAQIIAATLIKRAGIPLHGTLQINPVADEEANSCRGAKWLRDAGILKPDMAIIGEQTQNKVAVAERAVVFVRVTIRGRAAHGAMPWSGNNATVHMCRFVGLVNDELIPEVQRVKHPYLPLTTLSTTQIHGGDRVNVIPESCALEIDCRLVPGITEEYILRRFRELLERLSKQGPAFEWDLEVINSENGVVTDTRPDDRLIRGLSSAVNEVADEEQQLTGYMQGSDGRIFAKLGIPIAIFGPGDPALAHGPNEYVPLGEVINATKILTLTILRLLGPEGMESYV